MKKTLLILVLISSTLAILADECDLNQQTRIEENIRLKNRYPGSYLTEGNLVLVVPAEEGEVRINIGGCVHFGVTIELKTNTAEKYVDEEDFMNQILYLAKTYSQGIIKYAKLKQVIEDKNWTQSESLSRYYFFNYDGTSPFEVYERQQGTQTIIGLSYYK